jgi:sortase A
VVVPAKTGDDVIVVEKPQGREPPFGSSTPPAAAMPGKPATERGPVTSRRLPSRSAVGLTLLVLVSCLALWFVVYGVALTGLQEHSTQSRLYGQLRGELAQATVPVSPPIKTGAPVALITAASGGLHDVVVVEGTTAKQLTSGPGHLSDTPLPGEAGTSIIFGRSVTFGAPFGRITSMRPGDAISVTSGLGVYTYRVEDVRYPGAPLPKPLPAGGSRITLVTSASNGWRSGWAPDRVVYVDAIAIHGTVQALPPGVPASVSKASLAMQGDPGALVPLIFWLEAMIVAAGALLWSWFRWGRPQTWMVGVPILIALLWGAGTVFERLLPNLI